MKLKKLLTCSIMMALPFVANAQTQKLDNKPTEAIVPNVEISLSKMANSHYVVLRKATPVYHQPADTMGNRYARKLRPGTKIYLRDHMPNGLRIDLGKVVGEQYYIPAKSVEGLQMFVEI